MYYIKQSYDINAKKSVICVKNLLLNHFRITLSIFAYIGFLTQASSKI